MKRRVGILGGMGPEATVELMARVIRAVPAEDDRDHVPLIVDQNPQVPSRIEALIEGAGKDPGPVLGEMAARLAQAGAEALAMPCNTAHHFAPQVKAAGVPFLDMVTLAARKAHQQVKENEVVGVLCSPAVRSTGLYDRALGDLGATVAYADDGLMLAAIRAVKRAELKVGELALAEASSLLATSGCRVQILACSEFSLIAGGVDPRASGVDALDVLAREIVLFSLGG